MLRKLDLDRVDELVQDGWLNCQEHPTLPLKIFNYADKAQWERFWVPETLECRGLVACGAEIVARPFPKFFNFGEPGVTIPSEPFEVQTKYDGSLLIAFSFDGRLVTATRGSFTSWQAQEGRKILEEYGWTPDPCQTFLFEFIHPENRIVVDYGDMRDLVLLAVVDTGTGEELPLDGWLGPKVERHSFPSVGNANLHDLNQLVRYQGDEFEGFVVRFESGYRVKIKLDDYVRLHRLMTGVSTKSIWEVLSSGKDITDIVDNVPDEFYDWVIEKRDELVANFSTIKQMCQNDFENRPSTDSRKEMAEYFKVCAFPGILFAMLDGKEYESKIWKLLKPKAEFPFKSP